MAGRGRLAGVAGSGPDGTGGGRQRAEKSPGAREGPMPPAARGKERARSRAVSGRSSLSGSGRRGFELVLVAEVV